MLLVIDIVTIQTWNQTCNKYPKFSEKILFLQNLPPGNQIVGERMTKNCLKYFQSNSFQSDYELF